MSGKSSWKESCRVEEFQKKISRHLKFPLDLIVNENRSTMLSLLDRRRLSMHRMFLEAPDEVIAAVAHYVRGTRRDKQRNQLVLRTFIQENLPRLDYSHLVNKKSLITKEKFIISARFTSGSIAPTSKILLILRSPGLEPLLKDDVPTSPLGSTTTL